MTDDEFQRAYHTYQTASRAQAEAEAETVTLEDGNHPVVVGLPIGSTIRYCLMLRRAAVFMGFVQSAERVD